MDPISAILLIAWSPPVRIWLVVVCLLGIGLSSMASLNVASNVFNRILLPSLSGGAADVWFTVSYMLVAILAIEAALLAIKVLGLGITGVALCDDLLFSDHHADADSEAPICTSISTNPCVPFKAAAAAGFLGVCLLCSVYSVLVALHAALTLEDLGCVDRIAAGVTAGIDAFLVSSTLATLLSVVVLLSLRSVVLLIGQLFWLFATGGDSSRWDAVTWIPRWLLPAWARVLPVVDVRGQRLAMASFFSQAQTYTGWYSLVWVLLIVWRQRVAPLAVIRHSGGGISLAVAVMLAVTAAGVASVLATYLLGAQTMSTWIAAVRQRSAALAVDRLLRKSATQIFAVLLSRQLPTELATAASARGDSSSGHSSISVLPAAASATWFEGIGIRSRSIITGLAQHPSDSRVGLETGARRGALSTPPIAAWLDVLESVATLAAAPRLELPFGRATRGSSKLLLLFSQGHGLLLISATALLATPIVAAHYWRAGCLALTMLIVLVGSWFAPAAREGFCTGACRLLLASCVAALAASSVLATESHGEGPYALIILPLPTPAVLAEKAEHAYDACSAQINGLSLVEHCLLSASVYGSDDHLARDLQAWFEDAPATSTSEVLRSWRRHFDGNTPTNPRSTESTKTSGPAFFALHNNASNALHIVVRGTATAADWGEDMDLWQETALFQALGLLGPYGSWPLSTQQALIRAIWAFGSLVGGISLHHPDSDGTSAGERGPSDVEGGAYHADLLRFITRQRASLRPGATLSISGHSLGGGLATIVGRELGINSVSFAGPGLTLTGVKLGFSRDMGEAYGHTLVVVPDHDLVSRVDSHTGTVQHVRCRGASGAVACHSITRLCCELVSSCGDAWGRSLRQCPALDKA